MKEEEKYVYFVVILLTFTVLNYLWTQNIRNDIRRIEFAVENVYDKLICLHEDNCKSPSEAVEEFLNK